MIKNKIIVNDDKIDIDAILKEKPTIHRPRKSFKTAKLLDEINEKMPSKLNGLDISGQMSPKMVDGSLGEIEPDAGISSEESEVDDEEIKE